MKEQNEVPTISVSITAETRDRLKYIQNSLGLKTRSSTVVTAINEMYDRLTALGFSRINK